MPPKTTNQKQDILKIKFDLIAYNAAMETIDKWKDSGQSHYVTITNPHSKSFFNTK